MSPWLINGVGFLASLTAFIMFVPSARAVWRNRHNEEALRGSSLGMNYFLLLNATLWLAYALMTHAFWTGAPSLVNMPLALLSIYYIRRGRRQGQGS